VVATEEHRIDDRRGFGKIPTPGGIATGSASCYGGMLRHPVLLEVFPVRLPLVVWSVFAFILCSALPSSAGADVCDVELLTWGPSKTNVIKVVKKITGLGLSETKALVESTPVTISTAVPEAQAQQEATLLQNVGAEAITKCVGAQAKPRLQAARLRAPTAGTCDLGLVSYGPKKINVIKATKSITGLGLAESKALVESCPSTILTAVSVAKAQQGLISLQNAGAEAVLECTVPPRRSRGRTAPAVQRQLAQLPAICDVFLVTYGPNKTNVIKTTKQITGLGLSEAKALVEAAPIAIVQAVPASQAAAHVASLQEAGAEALLQCVSPSNKQVLRRARTRAPAVGNCNLMLVSYGPNKMNVIKATKSITGLGLLETKALVESSPSYVLQNVSQAKAQQGRNQLENMGATAVTECKPPARSRRR